MFKHLRHPATVIAALALFVAFSGGAVAYASGLISGSHIKNHSIAAKKLTKKAVKSLRGHRGPAGPKGDTGDAGPIGPSSAFTFSRDAAAPVTETSTPVATANLAAGDYAIFAKTYIDTDALSDGVGYMACELTAGSEADTASVNLGGQPQQVSRATLSMQVSHEFAAAGTAVVACHLFGPPPTGTTVTANWTKITAIQVGSVTNTPVTG